MLKPDEISEPTTTTIKKPKSINTSRGYPEQERLRRKQFIKNKKKRKMARKSRKANYKR